MSSLMLKGEKIVTRCWRRREEGGVQSDVLSHLDSRRRSQAKDNSQHLGGGKGKGPNSHWGPSRWNLVLLISWS